MSRPFVFTFALFIHLALLLLMVPLITAQEITAEDILAKARLLGGHQAIEMRARLQVESSDGERTRGIIIWIDQNSQGQGNRVYAQVVEPAFLSNLKFLHLDDAGRQTTYARTSRGVRRITGTADDEPLFGSDFTLQDFISLKGSGTAQRLPGAETDTLYAVKVSMPAPALLPVREILVRRDNYLIAGMRQYTADGTLAKEYTLEEYDVTQNTFYVRQGTMRDLRSGSSSTLYIQQVQFHGSVPAHLFSPGRL